MLVDCTCITCGKEFKAESFNVKIGKGKYCSRECFQKRPSSAKKYKTICKNCGEPLKETFYEGQRTIRCEKCQKNKYFKKSMRHAEGYI